MRENSKPWVSAARTPRCGAANCPRTGQSLITLEVIERLHAIDIMTVIFSRQRCAKAGAAKEMRMHSCSTLFDK
jgi:hypothetical protein